MRGGQNLHRIENAVFDGNQINARCWFEVLLCGSFSRSRLYCQLIISAGGYTNKIKKNHIGNMRSGIPHYWGWSRCGFVTFYQKEPFSEFTLLSHLLRHVYAFAKVHQNVLAFVMRMHVSVFVCACGLYAHVFCRTWCAVCLGLFVYCKQMCTSAGAQTQRQCAPEGTGVSKGLFFAQRNFPVYL